MVGTVKRLSNVRLSMFAPLRRLDACPSCGAKLPRDAHREIWVEQPVERGWIGAYRLIAKAGRLVVAEVRLLPDTGEGSGRWSEEASDVVSEGVPARALRALSPTIPQKRFARFLRQIEKDYPRIAKQLLGGHGIHLRSQIARRRPGRGGRPDSYYLIWAQAYVERLAAGSRRPIKDLAERPPRAIKGYVSTGDRVSEATVRDIIHECRERGLLTPAPKGRPGGELTAKAMRMLEREGARRVAP
jgi:hypothetical protein